MDDRCTRRRSVNLRRALFVCLLLSFPPPAFPEPTETAARPFEPGVYRIEAGETHRYRIEVPPRHFLQIAVEQDGADVALALSGPEGTWERDGHYEAGRGIDRVSRVIQEGGTYFFEVVPPKKMGGGYVLRLDALRPATARDVAMARAEELSFAALVNYLFEQRVADAVSGWEAALPYWRVVDEPAGLALSLFVSAGALGELGRVEDALDRYGEAAERYAALAGIDPLAERLEAWSWVEAGTLLSEAGRLDEADTVLAKATTAWRLLENADALTQALSTQALAWRKQGRFEAAMVQLEECVELQPVRSPGRAIALTNLGHTEKDMGLYPEAMERLSEARGIWEELGSTSPERFATVNSLGNLYAAMGDYGYALTLYDSALMPAWELADHDLVTTLLNNLGRIHRHRNDFGPAKTLLELALAESRENDLPEIESDALDNLARLYVRQGDLGQALRVFEQALRLTRRQRNQRKEVVTLVQIGEVLTRLGDWWPAASVLEEALASAREIGDPEAEAMGLSWLSMTESAEGRHETAASLGEQALDLAESLRGRVPYPGLRRWQAASQQLLYERHLGVLLAAHRAGAEGDWFERSFQTLERSKARSLREVIQDSAVDLRVGAPEALLGEERAMRDEIARLASHRWALPTRFFEEDALRLDDELDRAHRELDEIEGRLRAASPRLATLEAPKPLSLENVRQRLESTGELLLSYFLGDDRSYLWVIGRKGQGVFELPPRAVLDEAVADLRKAIVRDDEKGIETLSSKLSAWLLEPAAPYLRGKRLLVLPDGALYLLPFAMLPNPVGEGLLVDRFILSAAPSMSVLKDLEERRSETASEEECVAVLADPVFGPSDPRWSSPPGAGSSGLGTERLSGTGEEARAILSLVPQGRGHLLLGNEATREGFQELAGQCSVVHVATHGLVDPERAELSGLAFSTEDDSQSGLLTLQDIYDLDLAADLVTLSACQTAVGQDLKAEGVVGLAYGFLSAGAGAVVASLWEVDDRATALFMERFYREVLSGRRAPDEALRLAQLEIRSSRPSPRQWASFSLQGSARNFR